MVVKVLARELLAVATTMSPCWLPKYSVGIPQIDNQHKILVKLINDLQDEDGRQQGRRIDTGAGAERLARAAMGGLVTAMLGMIVRVCRHGAGVDVYGERADVAEHNDHCHADEQPGRQAPDLHEAEPSERPAPCQVFRLSVLKLLVSDRQYPESLKAA